MLVCREKLGHDCTWIDLDVVKIDETWKTFLDVYGLDKETIEYALARNERAHMDYHCGERPSFIMFFDLEKDKKNIMKRFR